MANLTFEQMMAEIETIVQQLESGSLALDASLKQYEKGIELLRNCHKQLGEAERRIEVLSGVDAQGNAITQTMDDKQLADEQKLDARSARRGYKRNDSAKISNAESISTESESLDNSSDKSNSRDMGLFG